MSVTFFDYLREIGNNCLYTGIGNSTFRPLIKIEWLYPNFAVQKTIEHDLLQSSGTLNINFDTYGERRSLDVTLYNVDKQYDINIDKLWFAQPIKLWLGIEINGEPYYIPQGIFYVNNPSSTSNMSERTITLKCTDKKCLLDGTMMGNLGYIYEIPLNTDIYEAMNSILQLDRGNGLVMDSITPNFSSYYTGRTTTLPDGTVVNRLDTPYTLRADRNSNLWNVLQELSLMLGALIYYDENGQLTVEPSQQDIDDSVKASIFDFSTSMFDYLGSTVEYPMSEIYNTIICVGDTINGDTASGKAQNINPASDTAVQVIGEKIMSPVENTAFYSDEIATENAQYLLKRRTILQKLVNINAIPVYHLKTNNIITLTDTQHNFNKERFLIQSISIPLQIGGVMQIQATNINNLIFE